jgi:hypothetical protein
MIASQMQALSGDSGGTAAVGGPQMIVFSGPWTLGIQSGTAPLFSLSSTRTRNPPSGSASFPMFKSRRPSPAFALKRDQVIEEALRHIPGPGTTGAQLEVLAKQ